MLSKVLSLDYLSCTQIWNIGLEKVGGRPAKLNQEEWGHRSRARDKKQDIFLLKEQNENFVAAVR